MEPLSLSNRYKVRCAQITSQESIYRAESLSRTRLSLYTKRTLGKVSQYSIVRECSAIPGVPSIVQYIRFEGGYKPLVAMPAVTCPPAHSNHERLSRL